MICEFEWGTSPFSFSQISKSKRQHPHVALPRRRVNNSGSLRTIPTNPFTLYVGGAKKQTYKYIAKHKKESPEDQQQTTEPASAGVDSDFSRCLRSWPLSNYSWHSVDINAEPLAPPRRQSLVRGRAHGRGFAFASLVHGVLYQLVGHAHFPKLSLQRIVAVLLDIQAPL